MAVGLILDKFSTSSAVMLTSKFLPSFLRGMYYPNILLTKF